MKKKIYKRRFDCPDCCKNALIVLNKKAGMSSFACVAAVKHILGVKKAGHAGTLDPEAEGVLLIGTGKTCAFLPYLTAKAKSYAYKAVLGESRDSYDAEGKTLKAADNSQLRAAYQQGAFNFRQMQKNSPEEFEAIFPTAEIMQVPPMFSALKKDGRPLYQLARQGIEVERKARKTRVEIVDISDAFWDNQLSRPVYRAELKAASGFYVRSYIHDTGENCGAHAYMQHLLRTSCGGFELEESCSLEDLEEAKAQDLASLIFNLSEVARRATACLEIDSGTASEILCGRQAVLNSAEFKKTANEALYASEADNFSDFKRESVLSLICDEELIAVIREADGQFKIARVFSQPEALK